MIWTSTSGITINRSERPNIVCGSSRLIGLRWRMSRASGAKSGGSLRMLSTFAGGAISAAALAAGAPASPGPASLTRMASLGLERIAGAPHGLQVTGITRVGLDLAAQPGHLYIDVADVAAQWRRLRQILARYRLSGPCRKAGQEPRLG